MANQKFTKGQIVVFTKDINYIDAKKGTKAFYDSYDKEDEYGPDALPHSIIINGFIHWVADEDIKPD